MDLFCLAGGVTAWGIMNQAQFESRKRSHMELALNPDAQAMAPTGLDRVILAHDALPELDFADVSLETTFLKHKLQTPFFVSGMTAGHAQAREINWRLAQACAKRGWVFGVGSQRRELSDRQPLIDSWSEMKLELPELVLLGNLGLSQLIESDVATIKKLVKNLSCNAFVIHLNALQEVIQPEGTPHFKGGLKALQKLVRTLGVPVILKETGCGFSAKSLRKIKELKLAAVDVSGLGGTHWGRIEGMRALSQGDPMRASVAQTFAGWGNSTVDSVIAAKKTLKAGTEIWASGGIRTGLDAAKLLGLGAHRVGFAKPALEAALLGMEPLLEWMNQVEFELKTALFCAGYADVKKLRAQAMSQGDVILK